VKYEGSIGLVSRKMKKKLLILVLLGFFMSRAVAVGHTQNLHFIYSLSLKNFGSRSLFGLLDAPHTQNFKIYHPKS
jgi:hypothetical protein